MDGLSSLPEGCISEILSLTSPRDVCRSAAVSRGINSAADSDTVWDKCLPSDYWEILSESLSPVVYRTKKQLFLQLSHSPILIRDGNMSFGLDKENGKKCYMIGARLLTIEWGNGDTPWYWSWIPYPESRFAEVAQLNKVGLLEIKGRINTRLLSWKTTYVAYLVYKIKPINYNIDGFWSKVRIRFVQEGLDYQNDVDYHSIVYLKESGGPLDGRLPRNRSDGWKEIELGELFCDDGNDGEVEMRLLGNETLFWKSGLIVQGIELRPKADI